uniref:Uncharacterized protein n=1 Tax=Glossina brevipalpis TaxID=37001 RepID=A0A1A9WUR0_9MUSC
MNGKVISPLRRRSSAMYTAFILNLQYFLLIKSSFSSHYNSAHKTGNDYIRTYSFWLCFVHERKTLQFLSSSSLWTLNKNDIEHSNGAALIIRVQIILIIRFVHTITLNQAKESYYRD